MKRVELARVTDAVKQLCMEINYFLDDGFLGLLKKGEQQEKSALGKNVLNQILENADIAKNEFKPMCQDTGVVVVFAEIGNHVFLDGDLYEAINEGIRQGYHAGYLRKSVVKHPVDRKNTNDNTPGIIHVKLVQGSHVKLTVASKGAGSENMSRMQMLTPADGIEGVKHFVKETVLLAGGKACPPLIIGVGVGGNFETSCLMAKDALMRDVLDHSDDPYAKKLEEELLEEVNKLGVGPMGFGGTTTAVAVKVNMGPCHIASLPVAVNLQCHANRHASRILEGE